MKKYITNSEEETENFAYEFAKKLNKNSIIVLSGDLGVGKTRFVRGVARFFGVQNDVSSPTFTIVNEYTTKENCDISKKLFHFDVYRLKGSIDFEDSIGTDYFKDGICIIEWGEIIKDILPASTIYINISRTENSTGEREIYIEGENL